jgi:hypothetical protein
MSDTHQICLDMYKRLDLIKAQIRERYADIWGRDPSAEELAETCWEVWRLTTHHLAALRYQEHAVETVADRAPYVPCELTGERAERIQAMDARLQEVLGDSVDVDEMAEEEDEEEQEAFHFEPDAGEQVLMVEYGSIIYEHREFVGDVNQMKLGDEWMLNIINHTFWGFDHLMEDLLHIVTHQ